MPKGVHGYRPIIHCPGCDEDKTLHAHGMCGKCYRRQWSRANPEKAKEHGLRTAHFRKAYNAKWRPANPDKVKAIRKREYEKNREKRLAYNKATYVPGSGTVQGRKWREANPERAAEMIRRQTQRRRARASQTENTLTEQEWQAIRVAYQYCCAYCGRDDVPMTQEHVTPILHGGGYTADNIIPACKSCNTSRRTKSIPDFIAYAKKVGRTLDIHPLLAARLQA